MMGKGSIQITFRALFLFHVIQARLAANDANRHTEDHGSNVLLYRAVSLQRPVLKNHRFNNGLSIVTVWEGMVGGVAFL